MRTMHLPTALLLATIVALVVGCAAGIQLAAGGIEDPGQRLFNGYTKPNVKCFYCHNGDGRGSGKGPDLAPDVAKMPDEAILAVIDKGTAFMPGFGDRLNDQEQKQILGWLRSAFGGPAGEAKEVEAEEVDAAPAEAPAEAPAGEAAEETPAE